MDEEDPRRPRLAAPQQGKGGDDGEAPAEEQGVGFGRPPVRAQFQPGRSGNPAGRPKGSRNKPPAHGSKRMQRILEDAFNREITVQDGGRVRTVTMMDAAVRALTTKAAKGDFRSLQFMINEQKEIEARQLVDWNKFLDEVLRHRKDAYAEMARCAASGEKLPELFIHPDSIHIDHQNRKAYIFGPTSADEIPAWNTVDGLPMLEQDIQEDINDSQYMLENDILTSDERKSIEAWIEKCHLQLQRLKKLTALIPEPIKLFMSRRFLARLAAEES